MSKADDKKFWKYDVSGKTEYQVADTLRLGKAEHACYNIKRDTVFFIAKRSVFVATRAITEITLGEYLAELAIRDTLKIDVKSLQ